MGLADYFINPENNFSGVDIANNSNSLFDMSNYSQPQQGLGSLFSDTIGGLGDFLSNRTSQDWKNYGGALQTAGGIGLGYLNYKNQKALTDRQIQAMDFQNRLNQEAEDRRRRSQANISTAFNNSGLGTI